jgi:polyisoprenyl-phosphate glycosyltransferase
MNPQLSIIIPIYNEEETLQEMYRRMKSVMDCLVQEGISAELILVDDGSRDRSLPLMRELHQNDSRVCYLSFARNFGHQIAVTAGLNFSRGQVAVILDADLQDPPELIPRMLDLWRAGYQVVYGQRSARRQEGWVKRFMAFTFYRILRHLADVDIPTDTGDFCLIDRAVINALNAMPERNRYLRGLRSWVGFRQTALLFEREPRFAGSVKYTFRKSFKLAINGLVSFSQVPLRLASYLGLLSAMAAIAMALLVLYWRLFVPGSPVTGFTIILVALFFLGAVQLISIGILGEYVGRIYDQVKGRPLYTLGELNGFESDDRAQIPRLDPGSDRVNRHP